MNKIWHPSWQDPQGSRLVNEDRWFDHNQFTLVQMANTRVGRDLLEIPNIGLPVVAVKKNEVRYYIGEKNDQSEFVSDFRIGAHWGNTIRSRFSQFRSAAKYFEVSAWDQAGKSMFALDDSRVLGLTLTAYPDANPETTTVDGYTNPDLANQTWTTLRNVASVSDFGDSATGIRSGVYCGNVSDTYNGMYRNYTLFDTSALTASAVISAATLSLYGNGENTNNLSSAMTIEVALCNPASNTAIAATDHNITNWTMTRQATGVAQASWNTAAYNDLVLNATGLGNISKTGVSKFGIVSSYDLDNSAATWSSSANDTLDWKSADTANTTTDPKLVVTYTIPSTFIPKIIIT